MAKSKLDFQQVLLRHGERIGLGLAGGVTALLVVLSLFMPNKGFFSGSPSARAKDLDGVSTLVDQKLRDPNNLPGESDKPPPAGDKLQALNREPVNAAEHRMASVVNVENSGSLGRRVPKVYTIEEAVAKYKPMRIQSYIFTDDGRVYVLKGEGTANRGGGSLAGMMGGRGGAGGMMPGGMAGMMGGGMGVPGQLDPTENERKNRQVELVPLNELGKKLSGTYAEQVRPVRMALIAAAFPFKKQVEEFRNKLALRSIGEVLSEPAAAAAKDKEAPLNSFHFVGARVRRRELDGNGDRSKVKGPDGKELGEWKEIDLNGSFRPIVILTGKRREPEDPELAGVMWPGLTMSRPMQFRESNLGTVAPGAAAGAAMPGGRPAPGGVGTGSPDGGSEGAPGGRGVPTPGGAAVASKGQADPDAEYPPIEKSLELIKKTIDTIKARNRPVAAPPPDQFRPGDDFDVFSTRPPTAGTGMDGREPPGGTGNSSMTPRTPPNRSGLTPPGAVGPPGGVGDPNQELELPEYVVVRLIDVTVEPGKTYEYQIQIRMANPNYNRLDTASPAYSKEPQIVSDWSEMPLRVHVDPEMHYYAVDQVAVERETDPRYRDSSPHRNHTLTPGQNIYLQAHRWLETVRPRGFKSPLVFGEWTVAERFPVWKGEYVGSEERVEVPVWQFAREAFTIASDNSSSKRTRGIGVYFGYGKQKDDPKEAILVDFSTGRYGYERILSRAEDRTEMKKVEDTCGIEALVLRPDGRLMLLEGAEDHGDTERAERIKKVRKRVADTKKPQKAAPAGAGAPGGDTGSGDR